MKTSSLVWLVIGITVALSLLAVGLYPTIQDFMAGNSMWNGIRDFSQENNVKDLSSMTLPDASIGVSLGRKVRETPQAAGN